MAKRGKSLLANALARQQNEDKQRKIKKQKLENKEVNYPSLNNKKNKTKNLNKEIKIIEKNDENLEEQLDEKKIFVPFNYDQNILIVGDGDFSYTLSIVKKGLIKPENIITTSFDSLKELNLKYGSDLINENLKLLNNFGVKKIYHSIDATKLCESFGINIKNKKHGNGSGKTLEKLGTLKIDNIIFNFPHIGKHISDINRNIMKNQELISNFYKSCYKFYDTLKKQRGNNGTGYNEEILTSENITITLFNGEPYDSWKIKKLARDVIGYSVERSGRLEWKFYEGYKHRRTAGLGETNKISNQREARIFKLEKFNKSKLNGKKRKHSDDDSDDDDDK